MPEMLTKLDPKEIEQLGPEELVRLLHRLLHCEARRLSLQKAGILVPFQITVPDGGRDGLWDAPIDAYDYIPRERTYYQCKAEKVTEAVCRDEVAVEKKDPKNGPSTWVVKPRVREVLAAGGCFAFFSCKHEIKPDVGQDVSTIVRDQLEKAGFTTPGEACIEFFGCNRIADWANKYPSAIRYVREVTRGFGGLHYFTIDGWSKLENMSGAFYSNPAVDQRIAAIRDALTGGKIRVMRLTGLSGVGKSRLVFEALRSAPGASVHQQSLSASTIYVSYVHLKGDLMPFVNHLADNGYMGIVVIDDCPSEIHHQVANVVANSSLSVITIFHEPQEKRQDTHPLDLTPEEMADVVENILREDANLAARGDAAVKAVADFAQGFPQIAKLITEFRRAPTSSELCDRAKLFQKLLSRGDDPNRTTLLTMQSLAMFRVMGGAAAKLEADLTVIRELFCPQVSEIDFRASIQEQKHRKVVQQIADTLMVSPRPLAVALAADYIKLFPPGRWKDVVERLSEARLLSEFTRRIEELEFSEEGETIGQMLLETGLPFNDAEYLLSGTTGSQMFRALAVLNPSAAVKVAKRILGNATIERLAAATSSRRNLVRALELLVWEPQMFRDAAPLLLRRQRRGFPISDGCG